MDYPLEVKQIMNYPRCRIYREFLLTLMRDRTIRTNGCSYLFYYMILCSYTNFRSSYRRLEGISYLVGPDEWICKTSELSEWFRTRFQHQTLSILSYLQEQNYITYTKLGRGNPLTNYNDLALCWGMSRASVSSVLNKLQEAEYLFLISFTGRHGSVIYLKSYLSTMFNISDVMIDKEEISLAFQIPISIPDEKDC